MILYFAVLSEIISISVPLHFHINFWIILSISVKRKNAGVCNKPVNKFVENYNLNSTESTIHEHGIVS